MSEVDSFCMFFSQISVTSIQVDKNSNLPYVAVHLLSLPLQPKKEEVINEGWTKGRRPPVNFPNAVFLIKLTLSLFSV